MLALVGLLALAAILRLPNLATRGTWDGDQGHDMLVVRALLRDGVVPLLGPPTSIGDFHHGALYYYLLAPSALPNGGDSPLAVVAFIALAGIAAVGVTWWLARSIGGPLAGFAAGLLMAVSIASIDEATFIWNPNLIALSSALALAGAWRAWSTGRARWWLLAAAATAVTIQLHVLALAFVPVVAALLVADIRRAPSGSERRRGLLKVAVAGAAILALSYLPLVANELTANFSETRAVLDYLFGGGREGIGREPARPARDRRAAHRDVAAGGPRRRRRGGRAPGRVGGGRPGRLARPRTGRRCPHRRPLAGPRAALVDDRPRDRGPQPRERRPGPPQ